MPRKCNWCQKEQVENLLCCSNCRLVDYCNKECQVADWKQGGHKILCRKAPKVIPEAKAKIDSFKLSDYTTQKVGDFMASEAEAQRGEIVEEKRAQEICYDALEIQSGTTERLQLILQALHVFPLSAAAWNMLGDFYFYEIDPFRTKAKECSKEALKMYGNAIAAARKLNPTWTENRTSVLSWGELGNRPYLRSIHGHALALHALKRNTEAIEQAENLLCWNPKDNQGVRKILCNWYLQENNIEDCLQLLREHNEERYDTNLAYTDVLIQFLRWKRGKRRNDLENRSVQKALYKALNSNPYVPDLLFAKDYEEKVHEYISPGEKDEAESYANVAREVWSAHPSSLKWLQNQRFEEGVKVPSEMDLIEILNSEFTGSLVKSKHSDLLGDDQVESTLRVTQNFDKIFGCGLDDFIWPDVLNQPHQCSNDILLHNNIYRDDEDYERFQGWRKTKYSDVLEVPFWKIILQYHEELRDL